MRSLRRYLRPVLILALVAACALALVSSWSDITDVLPRVGAVRFALATGAAVGAGVTLGVGWRVLLSDMSHQRLGRTEAVAVFSASQLGKYIPGSVWPVLAQMSLARRHGIARRTIVAAFLIQMMLLLVTAVVLAAGTLPWVDADELRSRWWLVALAPAACAVLAPPVQQRVLDLGGRLLKRDIDVQLPGLRAMAATVVASGATYLLFGLHLALLGWPISAESDGRVLVQSVGAFALAWAAGFVVVFAPAGLGVRELVLTLTMASVLTSADATAVAVLSRASIVLADLALGVFGVAVVAVGRKLAAAQHDEDVRGGLALSGLDVGDEPEDEHLSGDEQAHRRPDEARHPAGIVADEAQNEPAHHEDHADQARDR
jgi:hypothetical protein